MQPIGVFGKEFEPIASIHVTLNFLSKICDVTDPAFSVDEAGHCVARALRCFGDGCPIMIGDVVDSKWNAMAHQDGGDVDRGVRHRG